MKTKLNSNYTAEKTVMRVSCISIGINFLLSLFKLIAGIIGKSDAMISDAVHSAMSFS